MNAIFYGLVFDETDQLVELSYVGGEPCYVINDQGFMRHISAAELDRAIFDQMTAHVKGNEDFLSEQTAKMMGQDDPFTIAVIRSQLNNQDKQFEEMQQKGLPEDVKQYLGMAGFKAVVDFRGELKELLQPTVSDPGDEE